MPLEEVWTLRDGKSTFHLVFHKMPHTKIAHCQGLGFGCTDHADKTPMMVLKAPVKVFEVPTIVRRSRTLD